MDCVVTTIPRDAEQRRQLWREWIHTDVPAVARMVAIARRPPAASTSTNINWLPEAIDAPPAVIAGLVAAIRGSLVGDRLPYANRSRLIARAGRLGLNRFEANLLIAAVLNRAGAEQAVEPTTIVPSVRRRWGVLSITSVVIIAEIAAVAASVLR